MTTTQGWNAEQVELMGAKIHVLKGGKGDPLVVLHRDNSYPGVQPFLTELAKQYTVYVPSHPGYHNSDPKSWAWLVNVRDLAIVQHNLLRTLGIQRAVVVGLGFGGWLAAEIATMCGHDFSRMVLVSPMGVQPKKEYIFDQFLVSTEDYAKAMFHDQRAFDQIYTQEPGFEQLEGWETCREMTSRTGWKPYMWNRALPGLLKGVSIPTLIVWGREDKIVPLECAQLYAEALPNARVSVIDQCGHAVDLEKPAQLTRLVLNFTGKG